jgi:hypothetical protein
MTFSNSYAASVFFLTIEGVTRHEYINGGAYLECGKGAKALIKTLFKSTRATKYGIKVMATNVELYSGTCTYKSITY